MMKSQRHEILSVSAQSACFAKSFDESNLSLPSAGLLRCIGLKGLILARNRTITSLSSRQLFATDLAGYDIFHNLIINATSMSAAGLPEK